MPKEGKIVITYVIGQKRKVIEYHNCGDETYQDYVNNEKNYTTMEAQFGIDGIHDA
jgi:hypothetical protein